MSSPRSVLLRSAALVLALIPMRVVAQTENSIQAVDQLSKRLDELAYAAVNNTDLASASTYNHATYTGGNLIWNPYGSFNVGAEFLYGWAMEQNGLKANAPRIQLSAKHSFVKTDPDR